MLNLLYTILMISLFCLHSLHAEENSNNPYFSAHVQYSSQNPPSCKVIQQRLKNSLVRFSEAQYLVDRFQGQDALSESELKSLHAITRERLPMILDSKDMNVVITFTYTPTEAKQVVFLDQVRNLLIKNNQLYLSISAAGMEWNSMTGQIPDIFTVNLDQNLKITYKVSVFDYCFGKKEASVLLLLPDSSQNILRLDLMLSPQ